MVREDLGTASFDLAGIQLAKRGGEKDLSKKQGGEIFFSQNARKTTPNTASLFQKRRKNRGKI